MLWKRILECSVIYFNSSRKLLIVYAMQPAEPDAAIETGECHARNMASTNCIIAIPDVDNINGMAVITICVYFDFTSIL